MLVFFNFKIFSLLREFFFRKSFCTSTLVHENYLDNEVQFLAVPLLVADATQ